MGGGPGFNQQKVSELDKTKVEISKAVGRAYGAGLKETIRRTSILSRAETWRRNLGRFSTCAS